jgi:hypothetical protein
MVYISKNGEIIDHAELSSLTIPKSLCWITHKTWISNEKTRLKTEYQKKHFGSSFCSYRWNYSENKLEFNPEYFQKFNKTFPKVLTD